MKIAYFTNTYPRATDTFIRREVIGLRDRGFSVHTYSVHIAGPQHAVSPEVVNEKKQTRFLTPLNPIRVLGSLLFFAVFRPIRFIESIHLAIKTSRPGLKGSMLQFVYFFEAIDLARMLLRDGIEHIHNHFGDNSGTVTLIASILTRIPYSISIHGPHIFFDAQHWALDIKTKYSKFISVIGSYCRSQMMLYVDVEDWKKLHIIRCGIDPNTLDYTEPTREIRTLLYVGRLDAEKGLLILLESLSQLQEDGINLKLILLGDGVDRPLLEKRATELGMKGQVDFRGFVDQETIKQTLKTSDIFVLPSFAEGIPVSFMESMAVGTPVIGTNVAGVTELVIHNETGLVCHPSDAVGLTECIKSYIHDPDLYLKVSRQARTKVASEFTIDDQVDKLAHLFASNGSD